MKRLLRNVLAAFVVSTVGVVTASAQTWTGNAPQNGDFYLYNVGSGKFLTSGCWWGTHAAVDDDGMKLTLSGSGNTYTISTAAAFGANHYLGDNFYVDNGTAANWTFAQVSTGIYTIKNGDNYLAWTGGAVANNSSTANNDNARWQLVTRDDLIENMKAATSSNPVDVSFFMRNPKIRRNWTDSKPFEGSGFNDNGSFNASADGLYSGGCTSVGQWHKTFDNYQALADIPNGKYTVTVKGFNRYDGDGANSPGYMYANSTTVTLPTMGNIGDENANNATRALVDDTYLTSPITTIVTDGNLRIGVKSDATCGWVTWREFTVKFISPALSFLAEELPANGNMEAGKWYYKDITVAGNNYNATATNLSNIVYTTDGSTLKESESSVTAQFAATNNNLSVARYYIKSSTANNLVIEATSYTYNVGDATTSISYIQGGETVTVTYADAATNNPSATFAINGSPSITFNNTAVTPTVSGNGFTFTVPSGLSAASIYTLSIPANAFGYAAGSTYNAAQNITFNTPAVFDGTYYLKNSATNQYLARGANYGTRAIVNDWGNPLIIKTASDGFSTIQFYDNERYLFKPGNSDWDMYADTQTLDDNARWKFTLSDGKFLLQNKQRIANNEFVKVNNGEQVLYCDGKQADSQLFIKWIFEDPSTGAHLTQMQAVKDAQAAAAATLAGLSSINTVAALESEVAGNDWTSVNIIESEATVTESGESWNAYYEWGTMALRGATTVSIDNPGLYKFTIKALGRPASNAKTYPLHQIQADQTQAYVYFANTKTLLASAFSVEQTAITDNCYHGSDGNYYPNGQPSAKAFFNAGYFTNTIWVYIAEAGDYTYGIETFGNSKGGLDQWTCWSDQTITLTYYTDEGIVTNSNGKVTAVGRVTGSQVTEVIDNTVAVVDLTAARGLNNVAIPTSQNSNLLIYANSGQVSNSTNVIINGNCSTLALTKRSNPFFVPTTFTATNARYTVASGDLAGGEFATLMIPFAGTVPTGYAYTLDQGVNALGGDVKATQVSTVPANSPVLITGSGQFTGSNVSVPAFAKDATFTSGELTGVYSTTQAPVGSYVLQNHTESPNGVAFYLVNETRPNVGPFRAYIKPQSSNAKALRVIFINGDDTTGIGTLHEDGTVTLDDAEYYTVGGARLSAPQKGLNVVKYNNGTVKKIFVK